MTTIALSHTDMACDSQDTTDEVIRMTGSKITELPDGRLVGGCGEHGQFYRIVEWLQLSPSAQNKERFNYTEDYNEDLNSSVLIYDPKDNKAYMMHSYEYQPIEIPIPNALGSGQGYALGAMEMGATAEEAVAVACKYDPNTGGRIHVWEILK